MTSPSKRLGTRVGLLCFLAFVATGTGLAFASGTLAEAARTTASTLVENVYGPLVRDLLLNPWFYAVFLVALIVERRLPANPRQRSISTGAKLDLGWVLVWVAFHATLLPVYAAVLRFFYDRYLGFLTIDVAADWPVFARVLIALLVGDLAFWLGHYVRHKLAFMWEFHAVHHSQREMNFFTDYRMHPFDDLFIYTIQFVPIFMIEPNFSTVMAIIWMRHWHTRIYHSNIRSNFGWLRYVLVTPQSHRVHHSMEPRHQDKNFGLTFSVWDQLFGTQYRGWDEYPDTGVDSPLPVEQQDASPVTILRQIAYPFRALLERS